MLHQSMGGCLHNETYAPDGDVLAMTDYAMGSWTYNLRRHEPAGQRHGRGGRG